MIILDILGKPGESINKGEIINAGFVKLSRSYIVKTIEDGKEQYYKFITNYSKDYHEFQGWTFHRLKDDGTPAYKWTDAVKNKIFYKDLNLKNATKDLNYLNINIDLNPKKFKNRILEKNKIISSENYKSMINELIEKNYITSYKNDWAEIIQDDGSIIYIDVNSLIFHLLNHNREEAQKRIHYLPYLFKAIKEPQCKFIQIKIGNKNNITPGKVKLMKGYITQIDDEVIIFLKGYSKRDYLSNTQLEILDTFFFKDDEYINGYII